MTHLDYQRLELPRPKIVPAEQWGAINAEIERVDRALGHDDRPQTLGALKDLVESIARSVKELNGEPAAGGEDATKVISRAHDLLLSQPGPGLTRESVPGQVATAASKIVKLLPRVRNAVGTGHGRAAVADITEDEVALMLDGALMWSRWALRRLDAFCMGRPVQLIEELQQSTWTKGQLARRLEATDLTDDDIARQVGRAVGRRAASGTFTVYWDGIEGPARSDDLTAWPADYRWAAARALLFDTTGNATVVAAHLADAIQLVRPAADEASWRELVDDLLVTIPDPFDLIDATDHTHEKRLRGTLEEMVVVQEFKNSAEHLLGCLEARTGGAKSSPGAG